MQLIRRLSWTALVVGACTPDVAQDVVQSSTVRAGAADDTITLITGDRVQLVHGTPIITRAPVPGR